MNIDKDFLKDLHDLSNSREQQGSLESFISETADRVAKILQVDNCCIALVKEDGNTNHVNITVFSGQEPVYDSPFLESFPLDESLARHVAATGEALLIEDLRRCPIPLTAGPEKDLDRSLISAPIINDNKIIGVINIHSPTDEYLFNNDDLRVVRLLALFIGKSMEVVQLRNLYNSKYARWAEVLKAKERLENTIPFAVQDPKAMAKLLAKTFYKDMRRAGFGTNEIINTASEIISLLNSNLKECEKRFEDG